MAPFAQHYYRFRGETIRANSWMDGDRECWVAMTKYGSTEKVCRQKGTTGVSAKEQVLAQARVKIKHAQANAKGK